MKRCPKCDCGAEFTNRLAYNVAHAAGFTIGAITAAGTKVITKSPMSTKVGDEVRKNITKNVHKKFRCTNPRCNYQWEED